MCKITHYVTTAMTEIDTQQGYQQHRDNQIERILDSAEALFVQHGIDNVSMSAIARDVRVSRKTLYQYFPDKQEIAWAIYQKLAREWEQRIPLNQDGNGYQQLERLMAWVLHELKTNKGHQRFFVEFNTLYAREAVTSHDHRMISPSGSGAKLWITKILVQGIEDGSLRADINPEIVSVGVLNLLIGMNARFALMGDLIAEEYGQPIEAVYREICSTFLRGLGVTP